MRYEKYLLLLGILLLSFLACEETVVDEQNETETETETEKIFENCLEGSVPKNVQECSDIDTSTVPIFQDLCEWVIHEGVLELNKDWADWLPYYCCSEGDSLHFINQEGERTHFVVKSKTHRLSTVLYQRSDANCANGKWRIDCHAAEFASVFLGTEFPGIDLSVSIQPDFIVEDDIVQAGLVLRISHWIPGNFVSHLIAQVDPFTSPNTTILVGEKIFFGTTYNDLYSYENTVTDLALKMFYNKEFGIVAFEDYDGVVWKRLD